MKFLKRALFGRKGKKAVQKKTKPKLNATDAISRCKGMPRPIRRNLWRKLRATEGINWKQFRALERSSN